MKEKTLGEEEKFNMSKLISNILRDAVCEQIGHEIYNGNLYACMAAFLKNKGLDNLAKLFEKQREEEYEHSKEFIDLLTDLGAEVYIPEINEVKIPFEDIVSIANAFLEREIITTENINSIRKLATLEDNPVVEVHAKKMISIQQSEYEEATTFLDNALLCAGQDSWWKAKVWNDSVESD